jgi:hypothetical protein
MSNTTLRYISKIFHCHFTIENDKKYYLTQNRRLLYRCLLGKVSPFLSGSKVSYVGIRNIGV